jgi:hypothetical protein
VIVWLQDKQGGIECNIKVKAIADFVLKYFPAQEWGDIW